MAKSKKQQVAKEIKLNPKQQKLLAGRLAGKTITQAAIDAGYKKNSAAITGSRILSKVDVKQKFEEFQNELIMTMYAKLMELIDDPTLTAEKRIEVIKDVLDRQSHYRRSQPTQPIEPQAGGGSTDMIQLFMRHRRNGGSNPEQPPIEGT